MLTGCYYPLKSHLWIISIQNVTIAQLISVFFLCFAEKRHILTTGNTI